MKTQAVTCVLVGVLAAALPAAPASAISDHKPTHGSQCIAGAGTTAAELSFGAFGVANNSATDETVVCPVRIDIEETWLQSGTDPTQMIVHYRTGNVPGRIFCTIFSGSFAAQSGAVTSTTSTSNTQVANSITNQLAVSPPQPNWSGDSPPAPVVALVCVLGPKVKLGGYFMQEMHPTHQP